MTPKADSTSLDFNTVDLKAEAAALRSPC
ncbi:unnamed protein product [Urochloa humidicola]